MPRLPLGRCKPAEIPYCITEALKIHAAKGEVEDALLLRGRIPGKITELGNREIC